MMMSDVERLLSRISYKPGSKITVIGPMIEDMNPRLGIRVEQPVKNVNPPYDWTSVAKTFSIERDDLRKMNEREFLERLYKEILDQEEHELREFFKVDGKHFIDPHPENKMMKRLERWQEEALAFGSGRAAFPNFPYNDFFDKPLEKERTKWKTFFPMPAVDHRSVTKYIDFASPSPDDADEES